MTKVYCCRWKVREEGGKCRRGGQVEEGESLKEEAGVDIKIEKFYVVFQNVEESICNTLFLAKTVGSKETTSAESLEVAYFQIADTLSMVTRNILENELSNALMTTVTRFT